MREYTSAPFTPDTITATLVTLSKSNGENYVVCYDENHVGDALKMLGRWASDPELSMTWYDAAVMSQKIRQREAGL